MKSIIRLTNFSRKTATLTFILLLISASTVIFVATNSDNKARAGDTAGFTHAPIQFEKCTIELTGSEYKNNQYVFYYRIINTGDVPIKAKDASFELKNHKGQLYAANKKSVDDSKLNPNMGTNGIVTFHMLKEDLEQGEPVMQIEFGFLLGETFEFILKK